jgi:hypothetical protein
MSDFFAEQVRDLGDAFDDGDWAAVLSQAAAPPHHAVSRKLLVVVAVIVALSVAIPAMALSGRLDPLFSFGNGGTTVDEQTMSLREASVLETEGAAGTVKLLAEREGVAFYIARTPEGGLCPMTGRAGEGRASFWMMGCMNAQASASFPSPEKPVLDFSPGFTPGLKTGLMWITQLRGFAADGVTNVEVIGADGDVLVSVPVIDNVYVSEDKPVRPGDVAGRIGPAKALVALDGDGKEVWSHALLPEP